MARLRQWTSWHGVATNARRPFHVQTSLRKWALHLKCRYSLQVQLHLPVTAMFMGINSGSGPWYNRSRAGHNCQQLFASLPVSAYVTISFNCMAFRPACVNHFVATLHHCIVFILCSSLYFKCMVPCLSCLSSQCPHSHHNQSPNQHVDCCISPDRPSRLRTLVRFLLLSHIPFLLLVCCSAVHKWCMYGVY